MKIEWHGWAGFMVGFDKIRENDIPEFKAIIWAGPFSIWIKR